MNTYIQNIKTYIATHRKTVILSAEISLSVLVISVIALCIYNSTPKVVYQPAKACDLFTFTEAKELLGAKTLNSSMHDPVLSDDRNTASSDCGYADGNPDTNTMIIAAITIRSGVNDKGVQQNKTEFVAGRPKDSTETVKSLGDNAYFNNALGQLNILDGRQWIIVSYGVGSDPGSNTLDKAIDLGKKVLHS